MSLRYLAGFITASYNPLKVPDAPTISSVTAGNAQVSVAFTAPSNVGGGAITSYQVLVRDSSSGATFTGTGSASPVVVTGLTNGNTYTAQVAAVNSYGPSAYSSTSGSFVPVLPYYLYTWGANNLGQLGQNNTTYRSSPTQVGADTTWLTSVGGGYVSFSIKNNGTLWAWGNNASGQLGRNNTVNLSSPTQVGALTNWSKISPSSNTVSAIKTDGSLWGWGVNANGQVGQNNIVYSYSSPVQVGSDLNWKCVVSLNTSTIAIKTDGTLWSWGANSNGQLGQNNLIYRSSPTQIGALTNWNVLTTSAALSQFVFSIKTDGTIWSWGRNNSGQLGQSDTINRSSPVQVGALTNWSSVTNSGSSVLSIKTDGTLWSWGQNTYGQLGQGNVINLSSPVQVGLGTTWLYPALTYSSAATIKTDGTLWTWGFNGQGQLGQNNKVYRSSPVQVGAGTTWLTVSGGRYSMIATRST